MLAIEKCGFRAAFYGSRSHGSDRIAYGVTDPLPLPPDAKNILAEGIEEELRGKSLAEVIRWRDDKPIGLGKALYERHTMEGLQFAVTIPGFKKKP